jgi:hypothetical protein
MVAGGNTQVGGVVMEVTVSRKTEEQQEGQKGQKGQKQCVRRMGIEDYLMYGWQHGSYQCKREH